MKKKKNNLKSVQFAGLETVYFDTGYYSLGAFKFALNI